MVDARQEKGRTLANDRRIRHVEGALWVVPSQSQNAGTYVVNVLAQSCSCPDHETRRVKCKHQWAVEYAQTDDVAPDGSASVTESLTITRKTYAQDARPRDVRAGARAELPGSGGGVVSDLTAAEVTNVRRALAFLRVRCGGVKMLAKALHSTKATMRVPSASLVFRVARLAGVGVDDVLTGKYPAAGVCAHCGHREEVAAAE